MVDAASWNPDNRSGGVPQLQGAKWVSFEELKKCTNNFSDESIIGSGGYGKVFLIFFSAFDLFNWMCLTAFSFLPRLR